MRSTCFAACMAALFALVICTSNVALAKGGKLQISVVDRDTGQPLVARMHLKNQKGVAVKAPPAPFWQDHFIVNGSLTLKLPIGNYGFEMECGPEYLHRTGSFVINDFADDSTVVDMKRFVNMAKEGWWSGDLNVRRQTRDLELFMQADDLHLAEVVSWGNAKGLTVTRPADKADKTAPADPLVTLANSSWYQSAAGIDSRAGGTLLFFNAKQPLAIDKLTGELPTMFDTIKLARDTGPVWIDVAEAASWDLPVWLALGKVDSIEIAGANVCRSTTLPAGPGARPRDMTLFPGNDGAGRWPLQIYYNILNSGFRIPPTAGSGSGESPSPVGYNRVYVHTGDEVSYDTWWDGLRAGRVVVTNGPMIRPTVEGELPGHTFQADQGQEVELEIGLKLSTREKVDYLEVVKNGQVVYMKRLDDWAKEGGKIPPLLFKESGWFLVRAVTNLQTTYRFASSGPYYVEIGYQKRISKSSAKFFLDWVTERARGLKLENAAEREQVVAQLRTTRDFWQGLMDKATAE